MIGRVRRSGRGPRASLLALLAWLLAGAPLEAKVLIKLGTRAPDGSSWHLLLQELAEQWRKLSDREVELRIYAGGVAGDEPDMVRQLRVGKLHAAALTVVGLSQISPEPQVLAVPQLFESYAELDHVRDRYAPRLEEKLAERGFVVLHWGDAGWVHYFSVKPIRTPEDLARLKLFVWAGSPGDLGIYRSAGLNPVSLASTDILPALETGLIEAIPTTPLIADSAQMFGVAKYMVGHPWGPLVGATVISRSKWEEIPESLRPRFLEAARAIGERMKSEIRRQDAEAVEVLKKRGVTVYQVDAEEAAKWRKLAEDVYPLIRGKVVPTRVFDEVKELRDRYRAGRRPSAETAPSQPGAGRP